MSDRIVLANMVFYGRHGVLEEEQREAQPFEVDVELLLDLRRAGATDDLSATADYRAVFETCRQIVETRQYRLLEAVAEEIAAELLANESLGRAGVAEVVVRVRKPAVPLPGLLDYAGVEIRRVRAAGGG